MKRTTTKAVLAAAVLAATTGTTAVTAAHATSAEGVPTFKEFEATTVQDHDGQYIVNGDIPVGNRSDLRSFYDRMVGTDDAAAAGNNGLIVNTNGCLLYTSPSPRD
mgnify:CR=1 FL=1